MKKLLLLTLLYVHSFATQAFDFTYTSAGTDMNFTLVGNKITVRLKNPMLQKDLLASLRNRKLVLDVNDQTSSNIMRIQLNSNYSLTDIQTLIADLDRSTLIDYASPVLEYEGDNSLVSMGNELIVKITSAEQLAELHEVCASKGLTYIGNINSLPEQLHIVQLPANMVVRQLELMNFFTANTSFEYTQPNLIRYMAMHANYTNDPLDTLQYALQKINATYAWTKVNGGSPSIKVAVIDVGADFNHPDLPTGGSAGSALTGYDAMYATGLQPSNLFGSFVNNDWHGTACAGVIRANTNNFVGVAGLAYTCSLISIRYAKSITGTTVLTDDATIIAAIHYANYTVQADIVSCSWGGGPISLPVNDEISDAVTYGRAGKGCSVFFSTGNDQLGTVSWPASLPDVIAVGGTNSSDHKATLSNYGTDLDIAAPGDAVYTTDLNSNLGTNTAYGAAGNYASVSGTSFACPYAAGLMALILTVDPTFDHTTARNIIESTCSEIGGYSYYSNPALHPAKNWSNELGYGRINAQAAIDKALTLLPVIPNGPINVTLTPQTALACYNESTFPYFDIKITNGDPFTDFLAAYGYTYFALSYYTTSTGSTPYPYINGPGSMIVSSNNTATAPISNPKRISFNGAALAQLPPGAFPLTTTVYVDVLDGNHIHRRYPFTITIQRAPNISLTSQMYVCQGTPLMLDPYSKILNPTAQTSYSWDFGPFTGTGATDTLTTTITSPTGTGPISLTASTPNGCSTTKVATVHFVDASITGNSVPKQVCVGSAPSAMGAAVYNSYGSLAYSWAPTSGLSAYNVLNPNFTATSVAGISTYTLTVTNTLGCVKTAVFTVDVRSPQSTVNITPDLVNSCPGHNVVLTGTVTGPYSVFNPMVFSDASTTYATTAAGTVATATVNPMVNTLYTLQVTDPYGCVSSNTINLTVNSSYNLTANAGPDVSACTNPVKTITPVFSGGQAPYTYQWMPGNTNTLSLDAPNTANTYTFTITDNLGCKAVDQVIVNATTPLTIQNIKLGYTTCLGASLTMVNTYGAPNYGQTGGTAPFSYEWFPHQDFVNPYMLFPTTVPLMQTIFPSMIVTDANGCQAKSDQFFLVYDKTTPVEIFVSSDPCNGPELCPTATGGIQYIGALTSAGYAADPTNPLNTTSATFHIDPVSNIYNSFSYSPAPVTQTASCATFSPGTTSVAVTCTQYRWTNYVSAPTPACPSLSTTINYTIPVKDNARSLLIVLPNSQLIYVGTDQLLHRAYWGMTTAGVYTWSYQTIMPTNGWGNVRVEGWLTANEAGSRVLFKSTDGKLHSIANYAGTDNWLLESYVTGMDVKSDIQCRGNDIFYIGTDSHIHQIYWASHAWHYNAITPVGGWQGVAADGSLRTDPLPGTNIYFKSADNKLFNLWGGTSGSPAAPNINQIYTSGCLGEIIINPAGGLYFKGIDNRVHKANWNGSAWIETTEHAINNNFYDMDGYMAVDPALDKVFFKANNGSLHNIYIPSPGGPYFDYALDYGMFNAAGDLVFFDNKLVYINKDKRLHAFQWSGTNWWDIPLDNAPANVKTCTYQFRSMLATGDPDDDGSGETINPTEQDNAETATIYPNPGDGLFTVSVNSEETAVIDVYDMRGTKVKSIRKEKDKSNYEIDLSGYAKGIYMVSITSDQMHITKKLIIK